MAKRPALLNMNKPSSAETQAKPNSAHRHHSRTGQEAHGALIGKPRQTPPPPTLPRYKPPIPNTTAGQEEMCGGEVTQRGRLEEKEAAFQLCKLFRFNIISHAARDVSTEMGCDGGTIPKRHELVKGPKKVEKVDRNAERAAKWKYCALSQEKLRRPIVSCEVGRLYNKDAIIEYLLDKTADRPNMEVVTHIRGIKDIKELNLTDNPEWAGERSNTKGDVYEDLHCGMFICPVVGLEMNGKHRFCYLQTCGCVFSDRALKRSRQISATRNQRRAKQLKQWPHHQSQKTTPKILKWMERRALYKLMVKAANVAGTSSSTEGSKLSKSAASKRSVQEMTEKSEVFKSLFTTHSSAKRTKAQTSNWVTHTPYHF
ncbi:hypothetical protein F7725_017323 [Dissostichus mawsoni]|uniref:Replication termination factor 2 n=1 Tax=Dissostichus mawsoni TaxID=36200 RepID=A0A7J5Z4T1_DISMA|nr:hypothetical protein F7725_017323 [Dissostichus mawsoni]